MVDESIKDSIFTALYELYLTHYLKPLYDHISKLPPENVRIPGLLLNPEKMVFYVGKNHFAVEHVGSELPMPIQSSSSLEVVCHDYTEVDCNLFEIVVGFKYDTTGPSLPLSYFNMELLMPTNDGWDALFDLGWNTFAQNNLSFYNSSLPSPQNGRFSRVVNSLFFDANDSGLVVRHVKFINFFPIKYNSGGSEFDTISFDASLLNSLAKNDVNFEFVLPDDYKYRQLPKINHFIEVWGNKKNREPTITSFLAKDEYQFILTMRFGAISVHDELLCEWQSSPHRKAIKPDFFVVQPDGYADIVEFKLPSLSSKTVVGQENREKFSAEIYSYIAQTRSYAEYFDDPNNRKWFEGKYGFKVRKPKRILVAGRRSDFKPDIWRDIVAEFKDVTIMSYDDLIDGVVAQFYH